MEQFSPIHDLMELPWKKTFIYLRFTNLLTVSKRLKKMGNKANDFVCENLSLIDGLTLVDAFRMVTLLELVLKMVDIEGDIVECGSFKGGSGILMALALKYFGINKHIHLFDSFQGLPEPDSIKDKGYVKGSFCSDYGALNKKISEMNLREQITLHKGWFSHTVPLFLKERTRPISLLHIDCDLYSSTQDCFPALYPHVSKGGAVVLDDFNDGGRGEKRAVLELLKDQDVVMHIGPAPQVYFIKGERNGEGPTCVDGGVTYDFGALLKNDIYLSWLDEKLASSYRTVVMDFVLKEKGVSNVK